MTKAKAKKPIFLFDDVARQNALIKAYETKLTALNDLVAQVEKVQEQPLNDAEIKELAVDPIGFIENVKEGVRRSFPFPKSTESKNLELLGLSFTFIDAILSIMDKTPFKYEVKNHGIISDMKERARLIKSCKVYTQNQRQIIVLKELQNICDSMNVLIENGTFTNSMTFHFIKRMSSMLLTNASNKIEINLQRLLQIK